MASVIGIDVSAKSLDVVVRKAGKNSQSTVYANSHSGHNELTSKLKKLNPDLIVMEATGVYHFAIAERLFDEGLPVSVINPKQSYHFAKTLLQRSKTDAIDAGLIAEYGQRMEPRKWCAPSWARREFREVARQLNRLTAELTAAKNRLHALKVGAQSDFLIADEQDAIELHERRIERIRKYASQCITSDDELTVQLNNLTQGKGIGEITAVAVLGELCVLEKSLKAPQIARYAGLDVRENQSGSSLARPGRLSKAGNTYLRAALYMPALSAGKHDGPSQVFIERLKNRGKKPIQAQCALMRKMLTGIWACMKNNEPYDSTKLFDLDA